MILTLPVATRERVVLRLTEAQMHSGAMPLRIWLNARDYAELARDMRRYGFLPSKYRPKPLQVLNVPILLDESEAAPEDRTIRFEWSENGEESRVQEFAGGSGEDA